MDAGLRRPDVASSEWGEGSSQTSPAGLAYQERRHAEPADLDPAARSRYRRLRRTPRVDQGAQGRAALGARREPLDRRVRGELARMARDRGQAAPAGGRAPARRRGRAAGRLHARPAARHGRLEPLSRGPPHDLRGAPRMAGALRPGLDRSRPGPGRRGEGGSRPDRVHRVVEVGHDARAEHLQAVLLRAGRADARRRQGGRSVRRDHRSRLEARAGGAGGRIPARPVRAPVDRGALLRALRLRHGTGGHHGARRRPAARRRAGDGARLPGLGGGGQSGRGAGRDPGRPRESRAGQGHARRLGSSVVLARNGPVGPGRGPRRVRRGW